MSITTNRGQKVSKDSEGKDLIENKPSRKKYFCLVKKYECSFAHKGLQFQTTSIYLFRVILIYFKVKHIGYA